MRRKKLFSALLRQYGELIDTLMKQTVQLHSQAMATSILLDADSTDWANNKDFYEASSSFSSLFFFVCVCFNFFALIQMLTL